MEDFLVSVIVGGMVGEFLGRALAPLFAKSEEQQWEDILSQERFRDMYPGIKRELEKMKLEEMKLEEMKMKEKETKWDRMKGKLNGTWMRRKKTKLDMDERETEWDGAKEKLI